MNAGGPSFPVPPTIFGPNGAMSVPDEGMSLRDYFAAIALQGILSDGPACRGIAEAAGLAFDYADAMLKARAK